MRALTVVMALALGSIGCISSSKSMYGTTASYSVEHRSWVAGTGNKAYRFVNPVTGCWVRCRDEVKKYVEANASVSKTQNIRDGREATGTMVTFPLSFPGHLLLLPAYAVSVGLKDEPADKQFEAGEEMMRSLRWKEAEGLLLQSAANGNQRAVFKLGEVYDAQSRIEEARESYQAAVCRGRAKDGVEMAMAEKWLFDHGTPVRACVDTGTEPLDVLWLE